MINIKDKRIYKFPRFSGGEGELYVVGKNLHKIYYEPEEYSYDRILELKKFQKQVHLTTMPLDGIFLNDKFIGVVLKYFRDYLTLSKMQYAKLEDKIYILKQVEKRLRELTDNSIYLTDFHDDNVIIGKNGKVELIDLDGDGVILRPKPDKELFQEVLELYRAIIITYLYNQNFIRLVVSGTKVFEKILRELNMNESFITSLLGDELDYEILGEFIERSEEIKKLKKNK